LTAGAIINFILNLTSDSIIDVFDQTNVRNFSDFFNNASKVIKQTASAFNEGKGSIMTNFVALGASTVSLVAGHMCYGNLLKHATMQEEEELKTIQKALELRNELLNNLDEKYKSKIAAETSIYNIARENCVDNIIDSYRKILVFNLQTEGDKWSDIITIAQDKRFVLKKSESPNEIINNYKQLKELITNFGPCQEEERRLDANLKEKNEL
jgi:hypothetical protein